MDNIEELKRELATVKFKYETIIERFKFGLTPVPDSIVGDLEQVKKLTFELNAINSGDGGCIPCAPSGVVDNPIVPESVKTAEPVKRPGKPVDDESWIKSLEADPTYSGINIRIQLGKMTQWCIANNQSPTRRRFINWLNRTEKPLTTHGSGPHNSRNEQTGAANAHKDRLAALEAEARNGDQTGMEGGAFGLTVGSTL